MQIVERGCYASFPWYDLPEMHAANDALWDALAALLHADGVRGVPERLDRDHIHGIDPHGACLFTQTCGYPLFTTALGQFRVLGSPVYAVPGCVGLRHRSVITVRSDASFERIADLRGARFAINELDSNSGMNLPRRLFAPFAAGGRFFAEVVVSGSHAESAAMISNRVVDAAAIDCVTLAFLRRYRPAAVRELRAIAETASTPTPPLVTSVLTPPETVAALERALHAVAADPAFAAIREPLFLADVEPCGIDAYEVVRAYERDARRCGYPEIA